MFQPQVTTNCPNCHAIASGVAPIEPEIDDTWTAELQEEACAVLRNALQLLDRDRPRAADRLLTAALLSHPDDVDLWLAAGIARLRRGAWRSAQAALKMCVWLADDPVAEQLLEVSSTHS